MGKATEAMVGESERGGASPKLSQVDGAAVELGPELGVLVQVERR